MCFSAGASFTAGAVISAVGIATVTKIHKPSQKLFASIPLIFGIQQLAEGCVWLTLQNPGHETIQKISMYIFLITADVIWPLMIPGSLFLMEENVERKKAIRIFLVAGAVLSLYYAFCLISFRVTPGIVNCYINYGGDFIPSLMIPAFLLYLVITITPLLIYGEKGMFWLGILMFMAVVITVIFYIKNVTSVWCFFAAIISVLIYRMIDVSRITVSKEIS
ncbi:MAG: DUF6629 family protein [Bacteroidales bacterium]